MEFSHKFKKKRKYQQYYKDHKLVEEIFAFFEQNENQRFSLTELSQKTNIPIYQLGKWHKEWEKDHTYRPGLRIGQHLRLFTDEQEKIVADLIRVQFISHGIMMRRKHLKTILFTLWQSFDLDHRGHLPKKLFSNHFMKNFCKRNNFSFRQMRKKKRSEIDDAEVNEYVRQYAEAFSTFPWHRILNGDETPWNFVYYKGEVLAETGTEEVAAQLPDDYRKSFTVMATIGADGTKYPPIFFAKGSTKMCHRQFDGMESDPSKYEILHSEGGNMDEDSMIEYLKYVHLWMDNEPCVLIVDRYSSHITTEVLQTASQLQIKMIYIPTSATEKYQPLDKRVFGVLKSMAASSFDDFVFEKQEGFSKCQAADLFVNCWQKLSVDIVLKSWRLCEDEEEDENDSDFEDCEPFNDNEEEEEDIGELDNDDLLIIRESHKQRKSTNPLTPPRPYHK